MNQNPHLSQEGEFDESAEQSFIPDLCQLNAVLFLLLLTQIFALVMSIIASQNEILSWELLGLMSSYCHAITLSCAAAICWLRRYLTRFSLKPVSAMVLILIMTITAAYDLIFLQFLPFEVTQHPERFLSKSLLISAIIGALALRYFFLQHQWRQQKQSELRSRLQALQARIRPHFLFNSMNTIASLIAVDPDKAEDAVLDLSTLFRATLDNQKMLISLGEELDLCGRYLNIEALRLGDRLKLKWNIEASVKDLKIPPLTLQPLFENAIYHGIQPLTEGGEIVVEAYARKNTAYVLISNPVAQSTSEHKGNQIALDNIRSRFEAIYQERAVLKTSILNNTFTATLRLPMENEHEQY